MMHRRKARWSAPALAVVLVMSACTSGGDTPPDTTIAQTTSTTVVVEGSTLTVATRAPESLEAHHAISTRAVDIASLLHTGLTRIDSEGRAVPGLAESWTSDDLVTWTFVLKSGATFSDGTPITAQTFADSWFALASQRTRGRTAYLGVEAGIANWRDVLAGVEGRQLGLRVVDERTLEVQLQQNNPWLPEYLAHSAFAPVAPATLAALNPDGTSTEPLLGSGQFVVESGGLDDTTLTLVRRSSTGKPGEVGRIVFQFVESDQAAADAVGAGTADLGLADAALDIDGLQMAEHPSNQVWYLGFPTPRGPASSPEPRRALSLSIDRSRFAGDLASPLAIASDLFAPDAQANGSPMTCTWCRFDPEEALAVIADNDIEVPEETFFVHVVAGSPVQPWAESIAAGWRDNLGWPVEVFEHPSLQALVGYLQSGVPSGPFLLPWSGDHVGAEAFIAPLFAPDSNDAFIRYSTNEMITLLSRLDATPVDDPQRAIEISQLTFELDDILAYLPLAVVPRRVAHSGRFDLAGIAGGVSRLDLAAVEALP